MTQGRFISLEGGEGAGKSTQIALLADRLRARGIDVVTTREPGGTPGAEAIRELFVHGAPDRWSARTEALLVYAARADHVERLILPAIERGQWVISDRFADSSMAYQGAGGRLDPGTLRAIHHAAIGDLQPDLTLVLDMPVEIGVTRALARRGAETRFEANAAAFHERVRAAFREITEREPGRARLIDANQPVEAVGAAIWSHVEPLLP